MKKIIKSMIFMLLMCMVVFVGSPFVSHAGVGDTTFWETENNDSIGSRDYNYIYNDYTVRGTLSYSDKDTFKFEIYPESFYYDNEYVIVVTFAGITEGLTVELYCTAPYGEVVVAKETTSYYDSGVYAGQLIYYTQPLTGPFSAEFYIVVTDSNGEYSENYLVHLMYEKHEHEYEAVVTPGSCTEEGYTTYTCMCGDSYVSDYVTAEHSESQWGILTKGTCITEGYRYKECTKCHTIIAEEKYFGDHDNISSDWIVQQAPTVANNGTLIKICNDCGEIAETLSVSLGMNNIDGSTIYISSEGTIVKNGWVNHNGDWYYLDAQGAIKRSCWMEDSIGWVYLNENGCMERNTWVPDSVGMCYVGSDGYCKTDCWVLDTNGWCYVDANGRKATNRWVQDSAGWCYVNADGYCVTDCWMQDSIGWCYLNSEGRMATNSWILDSVGWCYVGANGYCVTDCWMQDSAGWCYLDKNGRMTTNAWVQDSVGWCYIGEQGYALKNYWMQDSAGWCYLDSNGYMLTNNWLNQSGKWYYFDGNGHMITGWLNGGGVWYYFDSDGCMISNCYAEIDGCVYYFYSNGAMLANETVGSSYVGSNGIISDSCYAYLAGADFRSERRDYPSTRARGAYVHAFVDENGDMCVLTIVYYQLGGYKYDITTLHNLSTGRRITDPSDYYKTQAKRYYGASRIKYLNLSLEISTESLHALSFGAFITPEYLEV